MARRARSKQAMQKLITNQLDVAWTASDTFKAIQLTPSVGFDDECIVKRIRMTLALQPSNSDLFVPFLWTIVQTQDTTAPTESTMYGDNLVVSSGAATPTNPSVYDHTITMRKLSGSSLYLCINVPGTTTSDMKFSTIAQVHYVES